MESGTRTEKKITSEQLSQVTAAILEGKYSWACVLILRYTGHNPLDYLPQRTYTRLIKENTHQCPLNHRNHPPTQADSNGKRMAHDCSNSSAWNKIRDLSYVDVLQDCSASVRGGDFYRALLEQHLMEPDKAINFGIDRLF